MNELQFEYSELYDSAAAIAESEERAFIERWNSVPVTVPTNFIAFDHIKSQLEERWPAWVGEEEDRMSNRPELAALIGPLAEPLVDYVNMYRLVKLRQQIMTFMKLGYLDMGIDEAGTTEYSLPEGLDIPEGMKERVIAVVEAYGRFNETG
ncbi:hypothetical protein SEA_NICEHOUSE_105 [Rhodococcus phage NiceHouse]|nr:hypothetical protein SEA_NICEHOUSE_105 [Rhodococcus phage NiceHouse]